MPGNSATLEICVETASGLATCIAAGADRVELCAALDLGGLTPSAGLMDRAAGRPIPCHAMIRPRPGDFSYDAAEIAIMARDIARVKETGLSGVVLGATAGGRLDTDALVRLLDAAKGLERTLHRAIDTLQDPLAGVDDAIALGFDRILTSGGSPSLADGAAMVLEMHRRAEGRIVIAAGGGLTETIAKDLRTAGLRAFHASCKARPDPQPDPFKFGTSRIVEPDPARIVSLLAALK